jgi:hypothetical protein
VFEEADLRKAEVDREEQPDAEEQKRKVDGAAEPAVEEGNESFKYRLQCQFSEPNRAVRMIW